MFHLAVLCADVGLIVHDPHGLGVPFYTAAALWCALAYLAESRRPA
jgi:hypothetical protein